MLHGAKWMFWSYVNGHSPDEQDKNKASCLPVGLPRCDSQLHGNSAGVWTTSQRHVSIKQTNRQSSRYHTDTSWFRIIRLAYQKRMKTSRELWNYNKPSPRVYTRTYRIPLPPPPWPTVSLKSQQIQVICI